MIYRVVQKARSSQYYDTTNSILNLVEFDYSHKYKSGILEIIYDRDGRLETLYWSDPFVASAIWSYTDLVLVDWSRITNIYELNLVVTTIFYFFDVLIRISYLGTPSENSSSI